MMSKEAVKRAEGVREKEVTLSKQVEAYRRKPQKREVKSKEGNRSAIETRI